MSRCCEGRVAIVTGAGGGLGAAHARVFAAQGAKVVVNDISAEAAQGTVDEIKSAGGEAIANTSDITNYDDSLNAVKQALDTFAGLHVVVNNAGICRDRMFASMTEADWDAVIAVHLKGHFCISSHAVHYWRGESKAGNKPGGRIINTTSGAGLQGSIGQSNYAAAKAGIIALTLNQAAELARYDITANAIAPAARTAMTTQVAEFAERMAKPEDDSFDYFAPENVSSIVVWLGSEQSSHVTGRVFESEGGKLSIADGWRTGEWVDNNAYIEPGKAGGIVEKLLALETPAQKVYGT